MSVIPALYLCGPLDNCSEAERSGWREEAKKLLNPFKTLDPCRRDYRGRVLTEEEERELVTLDLEDIKSSSGIIANFWKPSFGSPMEICYGKLWGIPVASVVNSMNTSPFIKYHSDYLSLSLEDACEWMCKRLQGKINTSSPTLLTH